MTDFINKVNVKWRLACFVGFLLLLIIGTGLGGLNSMRTANSSLAVVYEEQVLPLKELQEIDAIFQDLVNAVDKTLFEEMALEKTLRRIEQARTQLDEKWALVLAADKAIHQNFDNSWLEPALPLMSKMDETISDLLGTLKEKDKEKLDIFTDEKLYPILAEQKETINKLVQVSLTGIKNEFEDSQSRYLLSKNAFLITLIIAVSISLLASLILIRGITSPLTNITHAIEFVMQGDLTKRLTHHRRDEFGVLINGFNQMADYLCDLVSQIQHSGIQVTSSITELAATNKQQEATVSEHAATTSQIAASTTEITATGANLMVTTKKVNSLTKNAAFAAAEGHSGLKSIDEKMRHMEEATGSIVNKLSILGEKAGNIAGMVKTINKVADQTNLLSLNAAIEAEKAGEYGAGFSVVATEIRRLADQTAVATFDIEQMVQEVQSAISSTVMGIDKFAEDTHKNADEVRDIAEHLAGVIDQVEVLKPQIENLTEGIDAQTLGAKQISEAIHQLNEAAQQTAESIAQTSSSIDQLHKAALVMQDGASRFKVIQAEEEKYAASNI